jgi:hypothetical protein
VQAFSKGPSAPKEVAAPEEMYSLKAEEGINTENENNIPAMYVKEVREKNSSVEVPPSQQEARNRPYAYRL